MSIVPVNKDFLASSAGKEGVNTEEGSRHAEKLLSLWDMPFEVTSSQGNAGCDHTASLGTTLIPDIKDVSLFWSQLPSSG